MLRAPVRVLNGGGQEPVWSRDGKRLFFQNGARMMAVTLETAQTELRFSSPTVLFEDGFLTWQANASRTYDVLPDSRFLMVKTIDQRELRSEIVVVLNWFEEIRRRVPAR